MTPDEKMCNYLEKSFPEFVSSKEYDEEEKEFSYTFFASFGRLVTQWFENKNQQQIDKFFHWPGPQISYTILVYLLT